MARARTEEEFYALVKAFQTEFLEYREWRFDYEHPQFFVYHRSDGKRVYFTPDWDSDGDVHIQVDDGDRPTQSAVIPYPEGLTAEQLLEIVKPYLERSFRRKLWSPREEE